jgi:hypothetical protein
LASAIQSVDGAKVITAPKQGTGDNGETIAVVELGPKASLSAVTAAIEAAKTPHREHTPPAVETVIAGKLKPSATPDAIRDALKKADLVED